MRSKSFLILFRIPCIIFLSLFVLFFGKANFTYAIDLDSTIEDTSRTNYSVSSQDEAKQNHEIIKNASDISAQKSATEDLPPLPPTLKNQLPQQQNQTSQTSKQKFDLIPVEIPNQPVIKKGNKYKQNYSNSKIAKLRKGMKFNLYSQYKISDYQPKGTNVTFISKTPIKTAYFTIPAGTKFLGKIEESHRPQLTCNGGLLVISVTSIVFAGHNQPIEAVITKVGDKKVFFNNYKGKRTYLKTTWKKGAWGRALMNEMVKLSVNLCAKGSTALLSPFTFVYGIIGYGGNTILSPVIAIFSKGGSAVIPAGTAITIKLLNDANIRY